MKQRLLIFIVAYNAEKTIAKVLDRIPTSLCDLYEVEVLIIDDASRDATFEESYRFLHESHLAFPVRVLYNPVNQGYGGNQKIGYHYALENGFDFVALIHGDGQYAPECLPDLLEPLRSAKADAVFGSRMLVPSGALRGGMPMYKYIGNKVLTWIENLLLRTHLSEFHSGYRIYATRSLSVIPFDRNTNDFHFDTEIIIQLLIAGFRISELPIPTYYGDEVCHVNGMKYGLDVVLSAVKARLQHAGVFYDRKFDCAPSLPPQPKLSYTSPHSLAFDRIPRDSRVLELSSGGSDVGAVLAEQKQCSIMKINSLPDPELDSFYPHGRNEVPSQIDCQNLDYVLLLDVLEHLSRPEYFLDRLRQALSLNPDCQIIVSTGNVGFFITRVMLLLGQFNQGKRGILDMTHTRLFTFSSFRRLLTQSGFTITEIRGVPGPFPLALGDNSFSRSLLAINRLLIRISRTLFSYQIFMTMKADPTLHTLLKDAEQKSAERARYFVAQV